MKKLGPSIFTLLLLLIPSVGYSSGSKTAEKEDLEKMSTPPKNSNPQKLPQGKLGKFVDIDTKRDVALYEDTSKERFLKRFKNLFWRNIKKP